MLPRHGHRLLAMRCWQQTKGDAEAAAALFVRSAPQHGIARVTRFVARWGPRESMGDAQRSGRRRKVPEDAAGMLANRWRGGRIIGGQRYGYRSLAHASKHEPEFNKVKQQNGASWKTVRRAMRRADAGCMRMVSQRPRKMLSTAQLADRRKHAAIMKRMRLSQLRLVVFIDETTLLVQPRAVKVSPPPGGSGAQSVMDVHVGRSKWQQQWIRVCTAVSGVCGPVLCWFETGCTGVTHNPPFQARARSFT